MINTREYNNRRFSIYDSEEKTALSLMNELGQACNEVLNRADEVEKLANDNKVNKVSYDDLQNNYQLTTDGTNANFNGTWQGLNRPTMSEEGMRATVEDIIDNKIPMMEKRIQNLAYQIDETNIEEINNHDNVMFKANCIINCDVEITLKENAIIDFNNCTINGNLKITRNKNCAFKNRVNVNKDIILLGGFGCTFDILNCELLYIQNYVGWGGFYWNVFNEINCKAMQVRQAKLKSGSSALNSNSIKKLVAQWGLARNNWVNVWFRGYGIDFLYTEEGTEPSLHGGDKWDIVTCNPLVIDNIDFSYSNAGDGVTSYGIVNESTRAIKIQNGFIENIDVAIKGNIISENVELRNTSLEQITGENNFTTSDKVGKIGGFIRIPQPIIKDCYFGKGLADYVKSGDITITRDGNINNIYGRVCKLKNTSSGKSKITYSFTSDKTDFISITVLGKNIGVINCSDGDNHQYNLGHLKINNQVGYSVGRATVTKGNKVDVAIYSHDTEPTEIYGIQIFYGKDGGTIYGDKIISSFPTENSQTQYDWKTGFSLDYIKGAASEIEFKVTGNIAGQGAIKGIYKGVINVDEELTVTDNVKSFVYTNGGKSLFDIQFVLNGDKIECQFAKGYYGTGCTANFIDIKVNELFVVNVIN